VGIVSLNPSQESSNNRGRGGNQALTQQKVELSRSVFKHQEGISIMFPHLLLWDWSSSKCFSCLVGRKMPGNIYY